MADLLTAALLSDHGVRHAFNLRTGGVSCAPFESFNLGRVAGDDPEAVAENHRRFAAAVGFAPGSLRELSQVHGADVYVVAGAEDVRELRAQRGDALVTNATDVAIGVRVADCLPLLLADPTSGAVAAVHAGWRGTVAGVVEAAVAALREVAQAPAARLLAATFPHIRRCCFEVGPEVAEQLLEASPDPNVVDRSRERPHVDLTAVVHAKLSVLGLLGEHVEDIPGCTRCEPARFFSYRGQGARSGRHVAAIVAGKR